MKNRTVILHQDQLDGILAVIESHGEHWNKEAREAYDILKKSLEENQDGNYQAAVRYQALREKIQESLQVDFDELVGIFPGEHVVEFGKIMSLGLRHLDFEIDAETKYDIGRWTNECLVAGLIANTPYNKERRYHEREAEYWKYEIEEARGLWKKES